MNLGTVRLASPIATCLLAQLAGAQADPALFPGRHFDVPSPAPWRILEADLDVDGDADLVVIGMGSDLQVWRNDGAGGFQPLPHLQAGPAHPPAREARAADVDADGAPDLLIACGEFPGPQGHLTLLLGDGNGGFGPPLQPYVGHAVTALDVGDVDLDGKLDVILGSPHRLQLLKGDGSGGFAIGWAVVDTAKVPATVGCARLADVFEDGKLDLVVTGDSACIGLWRGDGTSAFAAPVQHCGPQQQFAYSTFVDDFDGDQHADVVLIAFAELRAYLGDGQGGLAPKLGSPKPGTSPRRGFASDLTGDGILDVVVADAASAIGGAGGSIVMAGLGDGTFRVADRVLSGTGTSDVAAADFDADGKRDLADVGPGSRTFSVHRGMGQGRFDQPRILASAGSQTYLRAGDLDGDGRQDLVSSAPGKVSVQLGLGDGTFAPGVDTPLAAGTPAGLALGDVDLDGDQDVVAAVYGGSLWTLLNHGNGHLAAPVQAAPGGNVYGLEWIQLGPDGCPDLFGTDYNTGEILVFLGSCGATFVPSAPVGTGSPPMDACTGDFDRDGRTDLVVLRRVGFSGGWVTLLRGTGMGAFDPPVSTPIPGGPTGGIAAVDLDQDNRLDLVYSAEDGFPSGPRTLRWIQGDGAGGFPGIEFEFADVLCSDVAVADLDGDGDPDVVANAYGSQALGMSGGLRAMLHSGAGNHAVQNLLPLDSVDRPLLRDFDGDGRVDVLATTWLIDGPVLLRNRGASTTTIYCEAKSTSLGCVPRIGFSGTPSATADDGFLVRCDGTLSNKPALLLYGLTGRASTPFQGGLLCLLPPVRRTVPNASGGVPGAHDCSGSLLLDMNSFAAGLFGGNPHPALRVPGTVVQAQWWGRDGGFAPPDNTLLSAALEYVVN